MCFLRVTENAKNKAIDKLRKIYLVFQFMSYNYTRKPRPGQLAAMKKWYRQKRLLLWADPGEGKTKVALDFIGTMISHGKAKRALVIAPKTALAATWEEQLELDCPWIKYGIYHPDYPEPDWGLPLILTSYDYVKVRRKKCSTRKKGYKRDTSRRDKLVEWNPDIVVIDEGHRIKNGNSQRAKLCHRLGLVCEYAIDLTGTPKGNKRILDFWSQFRFVVPGLLEDTFGAFKDEYAIRSGFGNFKMKRFRNVKQLSRILAPYIMRIKSEGLPGQLDIPYRVDLTPKAKQLYRQMAEQMLAELDEEKTVTAPIALAKMIKLRQISGGFIRTNEGEDVPVHTCKLDAIQEICEDLKESDVERVVIFAAFHWEIKKIREVLANTWNTYLITGKSSAIERKLAVSLYNSAGGALIAQAATGAETLNLQAGNYCIDYSTDYSYTNHVQRRKRIHRIGQTKTCFYYQLRAKGTLDARIYRMFDKHQEASDQFVELLKEIRNQL